MNIIQKQQERFQNLVIKYFIQQYNLKPVNIKNVKPGSLEEKKIYIYKNNIVLNNKIVNRHYYDFNKNEKELDNNKYSFFSIMYKNLTYKKKDNDNVCELKSMIKTRIIKDKLYLRKFSNGIIDNNINVIGRKYKTETSIESNSLGLRCIINEPKTPYKEKTGIYKNTDHEVKVTKQQKKLFKEQIHENRIYLDIEYVNDVYDDFDSFPISKDNSMIFMIGLVDKNEKYTNFTTNTLTIQEERKILKQYIDALKSRIQKNECLYIYHWSNADYNLIMKRLRKYNDLFNEYNRDCEKFIKYIDLLKIVKNTIQLESYSLKYVVKKLLKKDYDTDCQNGFDAMTSIIVKNMEITKRNDSLLKYPMTQDIIKYNKLDTVLMNDIIKCFTN